jgi:phosphatidylglycerophosphate synthase
MNSKSYRQLLRESFKSNETEEWLDVWFTRPIGLAMALVCGRLGITPNAITIAGILIGMAGGWMFHYTDLWHNLCGVALMMTANFCDSADGQLARLTNQKTLVGRLLDGFASDAWFTCIYLSVIFRLWNEPMPLHALCSWLNVPCPTWGLWAFVLCAVAALLCHSTQCALADYYRQIHLWFLKGDSGSELDSYASEQRIYEELSNGKRHTSGQTVVCGWTFERLYHFFYKGYCKKQERLTPRFQRFFARYRSLPTDAPQASSTRGLFLAGSRPLMPLTNILTHNTRAFALFIAALVNILWLYPLFEIVVLQPLYWWMRCRHEQLCKSLEATI